MAEQPRILIAEDVAANLALYRAVLERSGYHVDGAEDGETAVRKAAETRYALILMDVGLPGVDGPEATRRIRVEQSAEQTPIIALTADDDAHVRRACKEAGMNDFLFKPLSPSALLGVVDKLIG